MQAKTVEFVMLEKNPEFSRTHQTNRKSVNIFAVKPLMVGLG